MCSGSVSQWVTGVRNGDHEAAACLWQRYYKRLLNYVNRKVAPRHVVFDEEALASQALSSFLIRVTKGCLLGVQNRDHVWRTLVTIARRKAHNVRRQCKPLGGGIIISIDDDSVAWIVSSDKSVSPENWAVLRDELQWVGDALDEEMRCILGDLLAGYTVVEIAARLQRSVPTVQRRLRLLRSVLRRRGVACP